MCVVTALLLGAVAIPGATAAGGQVVAAVRTRTPLAPCAQTAFPRLGGECHELPPR